MCTSFARLCSFTRTNESGGATLTHPTALANVVSGVPAPEEWLLVAMGAALLGFVAYKRRVRGGRPVVLLDGPPTC